MDKQISPYVLLGVSPTSSSDEIHKAYRRLAQRFHPDLTRDPNGAQVMARINDAYKKALASAHNLAPAQVRPAPVPTRAAPPSATSGRVGRPGGDNPGFAQTNANARYREGQPVAPDSRRHIDVRA